MASTSWNAVRAWGAVARPTGECAAQSCFIAWVERYDRSARGGGGRWQDVAPFV